jgi:single-stranded-DNA-specific exonuclease
MVLPAETPASPRRGHGTAAQGGVPRGGEGGAGARWVVPEVPAGEARALSDALGAAPVVGRLLWLRGVRTPAAARAFWTPRLADLEPPGSLPDMDAAASRVARAVEDREKIAVCGDYDVDGMTGTALLVRFLAIAGADVVYSIPDREADGYGLSVASVERLFASGVRVAVTVDNGVTAFPALERARELGLDVVVTDHHRPGPALPPAVAIVDPHRTDRGDGVGVAGTHLCGCGLAFKLAWGVAERCDRALRDERLRAFLRDAVGLVALATVADVMPLVGENRVLVDAGLRALAASRHPGVLALRSIAGLSSADRAAPPLSTDDVAWRLAPRLNAAGRMNRPDVAIDLLTTDDAAAAQRLAAAMEEANTARRAIEKSVVAEALAAAGERGVPAARSSVVVAGEGWHRGVIGIVASRLVDAHGRPAVVIGLEGDGGRGSCRSARDVDLHAALDRCKGTLRRWGGHAAAAGLEIDRAAVPDFAAAFEEAVREQTGGGEPEPALRLDAEAAPEDFTLETVEQVRRLGPFGAGNPEPRFALRGARVAGRARVVGSGGEHLTFALRTPTGAVRVIAFRQSRSYDLVSSGAPLDLAVTPTLNDFRGVRTAELTAHSIRPARQ